MEREAKEETPSNYFHTTSAAALALWRGERTAEGPVAAVIGMAAIALKLIGRVPTQETALTMARELWAGRPKGKYGR